MGPRRYRHRGPLCGAIDRQRGWHHRPGGYSGYFPGYQPEWINLDGPCRYLPEDGISLCTGICHGGQWRGVSWCGLRPMSVWTFFPGEETGTVTTSAAGPTTVTLSNTYYAVKNLQLTPSGTATRAAVYDNIITGDPSSFDVYLFRATPPAQKLPGQLVGVSKEFKAWPILILTLSPRARRRRHQARPLLLTARTCCHCVMR